MPRRRHVDPPARRPPQADALPDGGAGVTKSALRSAALLREAPRRRCHPGAAAGAGFTASDAALFVPSVSLQKSAAITPGGSAEHRLSRKLAGLAAEDCYPYHLTGRKWVQSGGWSLDGGSLYGASMRRNACANIITLGSGHGGCPRQPVATAGVGAVPADRPTGWGHRPT